MYTGKPYVGFCCFAFMGKCLRLIFLLLWVSISFRSYGITFLFWNETQILLMKSKLVSTPHLSCIFHSWGGAHLAWPGILTLSESEPCSWADLPIKNSYIAHQDRSEWGCWDLSFILRQGKCFSVSLWQRLRRRALSRVQWCWCVPLRGKGIPGQGCGHCSAHSLCLPTGRDSWCDTDHLPAWRMEMDTVRGQRQWELEWTGGRNFLSSVRLSRNGWNYTKLGVHPTVRDSIGLQ